MGLSKVRRLKLITRLASHFSAQSYDLIDTAFEVFGIPTLATWGSGQHSYVLNQLKGHADEESLLELAEYAGVIVEQEIVPSDNIATTDKKTKFRSFQLFISHMAIHRELAGAISKELLKYGISSFVAHDDIKPTAEWLSEIERRLNACDGLIALLHDGFKTSDWTDQEIGWVRGRGKPVFAIRYDLAPYGFFGSVQAFNGTGKTPSDTATEIFKRLAQHPITKEKISYATVNKFTNSTTFSQSKNRVEYLFDLDFWNDELKTTLKSAANSNSQITSSFGVVERLKQIVDG